jgi:hypothetical protein
MNWWKIGTDLIGSSRIPVRNGNERKWQMPRKQFVRIFVITLILDAGIPATH